MRPIIMTFRVLSVRFDSLRGRNSTYLSVFTKSMIQCSASSRNNDET